MALPSVYQLPLFITDKTCKACGIPKALSAFSPNRDSYRLECKECLARIARERSCNGYRRSTEPQRCSKCRQVKPAEAFRANPLKRNGLDSQCTACQGLRKPGLTANPTYREKICRRCLKVLPLGDFRFYARARDGRQSTCRACQNERQRERWVAKPEQYRKNSRRYYASHREECLARGRAYWEAHKEEHRARGRMWHMRTREQKRAYAQTYYRTHKEQFRRHSRVSMHVRRARIRKVGGRFTWQDIEALFIQQSGLCAYCSVLLDKFDIDHKAPISRGGSNDPSNLALACETCNSSKHDKTVEEFAAYRAMRQSSLALQS